MEYLIFSFVFLSSLFWCCLSEINYHYLIKIINQNRSHFNQIILPESRHSSRQTSSRWSQLVIFSSFFSLRFSLIQRIRCPMTKSFVMFMAIHISSLSTIQQMNNFLVEHRETWHFYQMNFFEFKFKLKMKLQLFNKWIPIDVHHHCRSFLLVSNRIFQRQYNDSVPNRSRKSTMRRKWYQSFLISEIWKNYTSFLFIQ